MATDAAVFTVRPVFIGWITLLVQLPLQLFFTIWAGLFFGGMVQSTGLFVRGSPTPFVVFGAIAFFGVPAVAYIGKKLNYGRTEYRFYTDRLEFEEGFFSINKKVIRFRDIKEVTFYLATLATGSGQNFRPFVALGFGNVSGSGISVRDIIDPDQTFDRIRQLVDACRA
jgi:hypothetical protein